MTHVKRLVSNKILKDLVIEVLQRISYIGSLGRIVGRTDIVDGIKNYCFLVFGIY